MLRRVLNAMVRTSRRRTETSCVNVTTERIDLTAVSFVSFVLSQRPTRIIFASNRRSVGRPIDDCARRGYFRSCSPTAFDGAVHVALPLDARVLAREEQAAARSREPRAQRGVEGGIEDGIPAARMLILFPHDLARGHELRPLRAEPFERLRQPA